MDMTLAKEAPATTADSVGIPPRSGVESSGGFSFDYQPDLKDHPGPSPALVLQSLTMSNSNDAINLERLETIGDSFLKYAITAYLYCAHPDLHEGRLSHMRSKQVSNVNLYRLGRAADLGEMMVASKFEPHDNWLPPCYKVPPELEQALIESGVPAAHWNMAEIMPQLRLENGGEKGEELSKEQICRAVQEGRNRSKSDGAEADGKMSSSSPSAMPAFVPYNLLTQHSIPDKSIADCVEALIGAYLIACGPRGALLFMSWLGIQVLPDGDRLEVEGEDADEAAVGEEQCNLETALEAGKDILESGVGAAKSGVDAIKSGTGAVKSGADAVKQASDAVKSGGTAIKSGAEAARKGGEAAKVGIEAAKMGAKAVEAGSEAVSTGVSAIKSGNKAVRSGVKAVMKPGLGSLKSGTKAVKMGKEAVEMGVEAAAKAGEAAKMGTEAVQTGLTAVTAGVAAVGKGREAIEAAREAVEKVKESKESASEAVESAKKAVESGETTMESLKSFQSKVQVSSSKFRTVILN